jgi:hypothetical protein
MVDSEVQFFKEVDSASLWCSVCCQQVVPFSGEKHKQSGYLLWTGNGLQHHFWLV